MTARDAGVEIRNQEGLLKDSLTSLERALGGQTVGREYRWAASVADALDRARQAMQHKQSTLGREGGIEAEVDATRPTLRRKAAELGRTFADCIKEAKALHREATQIAAVFAPSAKLTTAAIPEDTRPVPDCGDLRRRAAALMGAVQSFRDQEANLVLESVNTDVGVGD